jgi:hypothetical protein
VGANKLLRDFLPVFEIPTEHQARIVSKSVAGRLCGLEAVNSYVARRIGDAEDGLARTVDGPPPARDTGQLWQSELEDWRFVEQLDAAASYDLRSRTRNAFQSLAALREKLEAKLAASRSCAEFADMDLSYYF